MSFPRKAKVFGLPVRSRSWITYRPRKTAFIEDLSAALETQPWPMGPVDSSPVVMGLSEMLALDAETAKGPQSMSPDPILEAQGTNPPQGAFSPDRSEADLCLGTNAARWFHPPATPAPVPLNCKVVVTPPPAPQFVALEEWVAKIIDESFLASNQYGPLQSYGLVPPSLSDADLCVSQQWSMPEYDATLEKFAARDAEITRTVEYLQITPDRHLEKYAARDLENTQKILSAFQLRPEDL